MTRVLAFVALVVLLSLPIAGVLAARRAMRARRRLARALRSPLYTILANDRLEASVGMRGMRERDYRRAVERGGM